MTFFYLRNIFLSDVLPTFARTLLTIFWIGSKVMMASCNSILNEILLIRKKMNILFMLAHTHTAYGHITFKTCSHTIT